MNTDIEIADAVTSLDDADAALALGIASRRYLELKGVAFTQFATVIAKLQDIDPRIKPDERGATPAGTSAALAKAVLEAILRGPDRCAAQIAGAAILETAIKGRPGAPSRLKEAAYLAGLAVGLKIAANADLRRAVDAALGERAELVRKIEILIEALVVEVPPA